MRSEKEIRKSLKEENKELDVLNSRPPIVKCKKCGQLEPTTIGGDEPWFDITGFRRNETETKIANLNWALEGPPRYTLEEAEEILKRKKSYEIY